MITLASRQIQLPHGDPSQAASLEVEHLGLEPLGRSTQWVVIEFGVAD